MDLTKRWLEAIEGTNALACDLEFQDRKLRRRLDAPDARDVHFEFADPVRKFASWPGKRNYEGKFWFSSTKQHVPFESFWERAYLATLDRPGTATAVASQPMWIRWPAHERSHAPDYFARLADGSALLVDVKPRELTKEKDHAVFDLTRRLAGAMGWTYQDRDCCAVRRDTDRLGRLRHHIVAEREQLTRVLASWSSFLASSADATDVLDVSVAADGDPASAPDRARLGQLNREIALYNGAMDSLIAELRRLIGTTSRITSPTQR
mgnify:FL=1